MCVCDPNNRITFNIIHFQLSINTSLYIHTTLTQTDLKIGSSSAFLACLFFSSMADDQFQASGNWWDSSSSRTTAPSQHSSSSFPNFTWNLDHHDLKPTSSISDSPTSTHPNLHMIMPPCWNNNNNNQPSHHHLNLLEEKGVSDGRFRSMFQENNFHNHNHNHHQVEWREKLLFSTESSSTSGDSIVTTSQGLANSSNFHMDSNNSYSAPPNPSILLQGLLAPEASSSSSSFDNNHNRSSCFNNFPYASALNSNNNSDQLMASQFLRASPPKQTPHHGGGGNRQLQFTNNTTFWNASEAHHHQHHAAVKEARPSCFFPNSFQPPFHSPNFDAQSKV